MESKKFYMTLKQIKDFLDSICLVHKTYGHLIGKNDMLKMLENDKKSFKLTKCIEKRKKLIIWHRKIKSSVYIKEIDDDNTVHFTEKFFNRLRLFTNSFKIYSVERVIDTKKVSINLELVNRLLEHINLTSNAKYDLVNFIYDYSIKILTITYRLHYSACKARLVKLDKISIDDKLETKYD